MSHQRISQETVKRLAQVLGHKPEYGWHPTFERMVQEAIERIEQIEQLKKGGKNDRS
jgi:hypothetical protein